LMYNNHCSNL